MDIEEENTLLNPEAMAIISGTLSRKDVGRLKQIITSRGIADLPHEVLQAKGAAQVAALADYLIAEGDLRSQNCSQYGRASAVIGQRLRDAILRIAMPSPQSG